MTDLQAGTTTEATAPSTLISFALKNGAGEVSVDTSQLPDAVYREALMQGLKAIAERGMSKLTKEAYPDEAERKAAIKTKAEANVQDMYAGKVKVTGAVAVKKASGAVMTEAMRLARNLVKDAMKAASIKISSVKASEITAKAKELLGLDPSILTTAETNLATRAASPGVDLKTLVSSIKVDPVLVAKAEADKAKKAANKPLSKTQAGKVAPRVKAKPSAQASA